MNDDRFTTISNVGDIRSAIEGVPDRYPVRSTSVAVGCEDEICVRVKFEGDDRRSLGSEPFVDLLITFGSQLKCDPNNPCDEV